MVKASSLYIVIVIALVIGILCSALIAVAYFYQLQYQLTNRYDRLQNNVASGVNMILAGADTAYREPRKLSLYTDLSDSVILHRYPWGIFDVGAVTAVMQQDTLRSAFTFANKIDTTKWCALYLADENRPLGVTGKTNITGNAYLPQAGIIKSHINNMSYTGHNELIKGKQLVSSDSIPDLNEQRIQILEKLFDDPEAENATFKPGDSINNSFSVGKLVIKLGKKPTTLSNLYLSGNIIVHSDTTLTLDSTVKLNNVIIVARAIKVKDGFKGTCQLFASDTLTIGKQCTFNYPSCIGALNFSTVDNRTIKMTIGDGSNIYGVIFNYEKAGGTVKPVVSIGKNVNIKGQLYSQGFVSIPETGLHVEGSVYTNRFLYQSPYAVYENTLVNSYINGRAISSHYLSSGLMPAAQPSKKVMQWLEKK